jgi:putative hemolysin
LKTDKFPSHVVHPAILAETEQFRIKFAENQSEVEEAQRLRFKIFNLEQGKGLESAFIQGVDRDEFDEHCLHLIVIEKTFGQVIGTYRLHLGIVACSEKGFYSSREYDIKGIEAIAKDSLELGRSCVSLQYRTGAVVALLWGGIAELMMRARLRYMLGCVSLEGTDPVVGWALYEHFVADGRMSSLLSATPKKSYILPPASPKRVLELLETPKELLKAIPPLFKGYLRTGCKICGLPALDKEFGTIDFMIIVDKEHLPERYKRHFPPLKTSSSD